MKRPFIAPAIAWLLLALLLIVHAMPAGAVELPNFRQLVKDNGPAVVNVTVSEKLAPSEHGSRPRLPNFPKGSPFDDFFKHFFEDMPQAPNLPPGQHVYGQGSGFIIGADGYVLTNAHVVKDADKIIVRLQNHEEKTAKLIGFDELTDVALIKIDGRNLPTVKIGDSSKLEVGDWVLAIGSPFGLESTATQGIVSATSRSLPNDAYVPFIQTDVAVNPGNSGGPLFNTSGEVVGINAQIFSQTGGYMGVSFAIPINVAMKVAGQIKTTGRVSHGWLGVGIQNVSAELGQSFGLDRPRGALVSQVTAGSPAAKAGIRVGDVIVSFAGKTIEASDQLPVLVGEAPIGKRIDLELLREGKKMALVATIQERSAARKVTLRDSDDLGDGNARSVKEGALKIAVAELNRAQREALGIGERGVLVRNVDQGPAAEAGIQPGDIILELNRMEVKNVSQFNGLVKILPKGKAVPILVQRDDNTIFLALAL